MCYAVTYDCTVTCLNQNMNTTKLAEGIIASDMPYNGCRIVCSEGKEVWDSVAASQWSGGYGINPFPIIVILIVGLIILYLITRLGDSKDEPPKEPRN